MNVMNYKIGSINYINEEHKMGYGKIINSPYAQA